MKKRMLALALVLLSALFALAAAAEDNLPGVGDVIHGFKVTQLYPLEEMGGTVVHMEHEKSGANLLYLANGDVNRSFTIGFRTKYDNDKGVPHVFEHACLSGSEKYPDPSLFFAMMNQTYNTFMNAMTATDNTMYPESSLSEDQLYVYADFVMDGVLHPLVVSDERSMMREAYRYELTDKDAEITLSGTVYSEMLGALSMNQRHLYDLYKLMYPGSYTSTNTGGDPDVIPTMTQADLQEFHSTYYHPSNALIVLTGELDLDRFLALIDGDYLSAYDAQTVAITDENNQPWTGFKEGRTVAPATEGSEVQTIVSYAFALEGITEEEEAVMENLADVLGMESSPYIQKMNERLPAAQAVVGLLNRDLGKDPTLIFQMLGADDGDEDEFKAIVDETIAEILENGVDQESLAAICQNRRFSVELGNDNPSRGLSFAEDAITRWAHDGDVKAYQTEYEVFDKLGEYVENDAFDAIFKKYMTSPARSVLLATVTQPGLQKLNDERLAMELQDMKAAMTDEEIDALIAKTADFAAWTEANANSTMIDQMKAVSAQDLPEELTVYNAEAKDVDGVRMITSTVEIGDLTAVGMVLDTSAVPADKLSEFSFYASLLGSMPTENYTVEALQTKAALLTNSISIDVGALELEGGGYAPMLMAQFVSMKDDVDEAMALVEEILTKTSLDDTDQLMMNAMQAAFMPGYIAQNDPTQLANILLPAMTTQAGKYNYFVSFLQTDFAESLLDMDESELEAAKADMEQVWRLALNGNNASAFCIGDEEAQAKAEQAATAFIATLDHTEREAVDYMALDTGLHGNVAVEVPGSVQYNYLVLPTKETGFAYSGKADVMTAMVSDQLMIPIMRFQYSAYGASAGMGKRNLIVSTYRDPNLATTYEVFGQLGDMIRALDLTQDDLDGYITSAFGTLAMPMSAINGGAAAVNDVLQGTDTFGETKEKMHVMKQFTPEDVQTYAAMYDKLAEQGVKLCIGSAAEIEENAGMFDTILSNWAE